MTRKQAIVKAISDLKNAIISLEINREYHLWLDTEDSKLEADKARVNIENAKKKIEFLKKLS